MKGGINLKWLAIFNIAFGIFYLIYSISFRDKPTIYFKDIKIIEGKEDKYLKLQLYFSISISLIFILVGIIVGKYNIDYIYILLTPLILHVVNFMVKVIAKAKGYVES